MTIKLVDYQKRIKQINETLALQEVKKDSRLKKKLYGIRSGFEAEASMAYELDVHFKDQKDIVVLNDIKIEHNGFTAQIDHLVLTCYSAYFIETKESHKAIKVNQYLDWFRDGKPIKSPISQSENHGKILFDLLENNIKHFMSKSFGIYHKLGTYTQYHYIAIGGNANIEGDGRKLIKDQLLKYDQITKNILNHHKKSSKKYLIADLKDNDKFKTLDTKELKKMAEFILDNDISEDDPLKAFNIEAPQASIQNNEAACSNARKCDKCSNEMILKNIYGYRWVCQNCNFTDKVIEYCPDCKSKMGMRSSKSKYYLVCKKCDYKKLYYII